jgi:hypothetical protein
MRTTYFRKSMAMKTAKAPTATTIKGKLRAIPILHNSPNGRALNDDEAVGLPKMFPGVLAAGRASPASAGIFNRDEFHSIRAFSTMVKARVSSI